MLFHHQPGCCDYPLRAVVVWHSFAKYPAVWFILGQGRFQVCNSDLIHHIKYLVSSGLRCIYRAAHERDRYCRVTLQYEKSCWVTSHWESPGGAHLNMNYCPPIYWVVLFFFYLPRISDCLFNLRVLPSFLGEKEFKALIDWFYQREFLISGDINNGKVLEEMWTFPHVQLMFWLTSAGGTFTQSR